MVLSLILSIAIAAAAVGENKPDFEKPLDIKNVQVEQKDRKTGYTATIGIDCYYFPAFMIKGTNESGMSGGGRIDVVPSTPQSPAKCVLASGPGTRTISGAGYFLGVKGGYVFITDDGADGAAPLFVMDPRTGKAVLKDNLSGNPAFVPVAGSTLVLRYKRVAWPGCSLITTPGCWAPFAKKHGLPSSPPDCRKSYQKIAEDLSKESCTGNKDYEGCVKEQIKLRLELDNNSVISYPVEVVLGATPVVKRLPGEISCRGAD